MNRSDWRLIKNYELSLSTANTPGISTVLISNFQDTNVQIIGAGAMVAAYRARRGDFNMPQATGDSGHVLFYLLPVAPVGTRSESTFPYQASHDGDQLLIGRGNDQGAATTVYNGTPLLTDGSTSLLDFYDNNGGSTIVLQDTISSNLFLHGGEATLTFINSATVAGWDTATAALGGDFGQLNPTGSGGAKISDSDASAVTLIANFILGRDRLEISLLAGSGAYKVSDLFLGGNAGWRGTMPWRSPIRPASAVSWSSERSPRRRRRTPAPQSRAASPTCSFHKAPRHRIRLPLRPGADHFRGPSATGSWGNRPDAGPTSRRPAVASRRPRFDQQRAFSLPSRPQPPHTTAMSRRVLEITPELVLRAYRHGLFPMAETRHGGRLFWLDPERRGVLPLDRFHLPRRLLRTVLSGAFEVGADLDFPATIAGCATAQPGRVDTWISPQIEHLFTELHHMGYAHSVECRRDGELVGGLYGVAIGGVFFGESMFSFARDASKTALVHLVARLRLGGFHLLDTQFVTAHLTQFGAEEIPRQAYRERLIAGLEAPALWLPAPPPQALEAGIRALAGQLRA